MSEYYNPGDPFAWVARAAKPAAELREMLAMGREKPVHVEQRIDEGQESDRRRYMLTLKYGISEEAVKAADACLEKLRNIRKFFLFLDEEVYMTSTDESINAYVLGIVDENVQGDEALGRLVSSSICTPGRIAEFIERHREHTNDADLKRLQIQIALFKLRTLQEQMPKRG